MKKTLIAAALFAALGTAHAANPSQTFEFSNCLTGCTSQSVSSVATLQMTQITNGVEFTLTSTVPSGSFIGGFYMNGIIGSVDWMVNGYQGYKNYEFSTVSRATTTGAPGYNWDFTFKTAANADRFLNGDVAKWSITGTGVDLADFTSPAKLMTHVQGLTTGTSFNATSAKLSGSVVTPVPEPETYAMFLAGLGIMGAIARRRKQQA